MKTKPAYRIPDASAADRMQRVDRLQRDMKRLEDRARVVFAGARSRHDDAFYLEDHSRPQYGWSDA